MSSPHITRYGKPPLEIMPTMYNVNFYSCDYDVGYIMFIAQSRPSTNLCKGHCIQKTSLKLRDFNIIALTPILLLRTSLSL